jgi:hypothetical protein
MTNSVPLAPLDANGTSIGVGDRVEVLTIPHWLTHDLPSEDQLRLKGFEGKVIPIAEIDKFGYLWFSLPEVDFCLRPEEVRRV